jgi:hypothetical protein
MPTRCPVMKAFNTKGKVVTVYCGLWSCKRCQKVLARQWAWRVRIHVDKAGKPAYFWTLTLRPSVRSAAQGFRVLPRLWDTFRKVVQRTSGKWEYVAFVEGQPKRGNIPHFHIISMSKAPKRLKDIAMYAGFGHQAKEKRVDGPGAASYVAKYASKQNEDTPKGFRRVRASRSWSKLPEGEFDGFIVKAYTETLASYLLRVNELTGISLEDLLQRWSDAHNWED